MISLLKTSTLPRGRGCTANLSPATTVSPFTPPTMASDFRHHGASSQASLQRASSKHQLPCWDIWEPGGWMLGKPEPRGGRSQEPTGIQKEAGRGPFPDHKPHYSPWRSRLQVCEAHSGLPGSQMPNRQLFLLHPSYHRPPEAPAPPASSLLPPPLFLPSPQHKAKDMHVQSHALRSAPQHRKGKAMSEVGKLRQGTHEAVERVSCGAGCVSCLCPFLSGLRQRTEPLSV